MNRIATTAGLFPSPDAADPRCAVVDAQRAAGMDRIVEGQVGWTDGLAHPLSVHENVTGGEEAEYFGTGATYRRPVVTGELTFDGGMAADLAAVDAAAENLQAVVPGPYTLASLAADEHYGDFEELLAGVVSFLVGEVEAFPPHRTLLLLEPSLVATPPEDGEDARASDAVDAVADATDAAVVAHTARGAMTEKVHAHLLDADVDAVGYDFVAAPEANLSLVNEFGTKDDIALGFVAGEDPTVEPPETIRRRVEWLVEHTPPVIEFDRAYVTTNTELRSLPWETARRKLDALGAAVAGEPEE